MNKETPVANRVIHQRDTERNRCILTDKILRIKVSTLRLSLLILAPCRGSTKREIVNPQKMQNYPGLIRFVHDECGV